MIRVSNDNLGRALHASLYERIRTFALAHTPEMPPEPFVNTILTRLYNGDPHLYIFVELDEAYKIVMHAVADVQSAFGTAVLHCYQLQRDKPDQAKLDECMETFDKIAVAHNVQCMLFTVEKASKVYEKRYGYRIARSVMIKTPGIADEDDDHG